MALKMGIIGYGGMADWHHENIKNVPNTEVIGAYDIRDEIKEKIVEKKLISYASADELCADPQIDLVLVATPNDTHKMYSIMALRAGKNVICEKPVTMNTAELEEVIDVSKQCGKVFTIHQNRRWDNDFLTIKKILDTGILTNPYMIETRVQGSRRYLHEWRGYAVNGGGMVYDWGVHLIDQVLCLFPEKIISIDAHLQEIYSNEVDDNFTLTFRYESGLSVLVNVATNCFVTQPRWHVSCKDGTAVIDDWDCSGKIVKLNEDAGDLSWDELIVYTAAGPTRTMAPRPKETTVELKLPKVKSNWIEFYKNVYDVITKNAELIVKPEQAFRTMRVIDAVFESSRIKGSVSCER